MRNPNAEIRNPKEARSPKSEIGGRRMPSFSGFGFRPALRDFGFRASVFGFAIA
jgi:hypothetical protein